MVSFNNDKINIQTEFDKDQHPNLVDALLSTCMGALQNPKSVTEQTANAVHMVLDLTNQLSLNGSQMKTDNTPNKK